ncbi:MAG: hypothetical protein J6W75_08715 [Bacteroidaceae bacterium]|nr:hypothetical protein [Bacteroidaceae bacterium]
MKHAFRLFMTVSFLTTAFSLCQAQEPTITSSFNAQKVILPSSQYTPAQRWQAQVMVFNNGKRYADADYNHVWGTPPEDAAGHKWFEQDYLLTDGEKTWHQESSPFSSDEVYLGQRSYRWITSDITGDIYLRRTFTLSEPVAGNIFLTCGHDDAPSEFYINGVLVWKVNDGWNNNEYTLLTTEQKALVKTDGTENVLAVHVHQNWGGALADCGLYEADMAKTTNLLATLQDGPWECFYYFLNDNTGLNRLSPAEWTGRCADERDWIFGYGPLSNSKDQFLTTEWASQQQPLLVRRHFTLTDEMLSKIADSKLILTCSYDENPKVYLNGTLIWSTSGWNDNDYASYTLTTSNKNLLKEGDNVLCVSLQQGNGGGHIDYGLSITEPYDPTPVDVTTPTHRQTPAGDECYDLQGRKVTSPRTSAGILIQGGKKLIVKP